MGLNGKADRSMVAEVWLYPDGSRILELSTKCEPSDALTVAAETRAYLVDKKVPTNGLQETKTRTALEFYSKQLMAEMAAVQAEERRETRRRDGQGRVSVSVSGKAKGGRGGQAKCRDEGQGCNQTEAGLEAECGLEATARREACGEDHAECGNGEDGTRAPAGRGQDRSGEAGRGEDASRNGRASHSDARHDSPHASKGVLTQSPSRCAVGSDVGPVGTARFQSDPINLTAENTNSRQAAPGRASGRRANRPTARLYVSGPSGLSCPLDGVWNGRSMPVASRYALAAAVTVG